jgi:anti-sigma B factor antagonist
MDIHIDRCPDEAGVILVVRGRLDADSSGELRHAVAAEVRRGIHTIGLDLVGTTFLSSAGIRVLFETQREARAAGGDCRITAASDPVRKVLELTRLDTILMQPAGAITTGPAAAAHAHEPAPTPGRDMVAPGMRLTVFDPPAGELPCHVHGSRTALTGAVHGAERLPLPPGTFAIGIASIADDGSPAAAAGEWLAASGAVFQRPPRPFAAVDYVLGTGAFVPEADVVSGLSWTGVPAGLAVFEPVDDASGVAIDDVAAVLLDAADTDAIALVLVGEIHGLVAAELIRPLAEATPGDHPLTGGRDGTARWLCFSREPVHAGRTAVVVGIVTRRSAGPWEDVVAPLGPAGAQGHLHAVVFPHRSLGRAGRDLSVILSDVAAAEPIALVHLMADERPVLGDGRSGFVRGSCWFAPLAWPGGSGDDA